MRSPKKARGKSTPKTKQRHEACAHEPVTLEEKFQNLAEVYQTDDPEIIKHQIMWRYIHAMSMQVLTPGNRPHIEHHAKQFELCDKYTEHQCTEYERLARLEPTHGNILTLVGQLRQQLKALKEKQGHDMALPLEMLLLNVNNSFGHLV